MILSVAACMTFFAAVYDLVIRIIAVKMTVNTADRFEMRISIAAFMAGDAALDCISVVMIISVAIIVADNAAICFSVVAIVFVVACMRRIAAVKRSVVLTAVAFVVSVDSAACPSVVFFVKACMIRVAAIESVVVAAIETVVAFNVAP